MANFSKKTQYKYEVNGTAARKLEHFDAVPNYTIGEEANMKKMKTSKDVKVKKKLNKSILFFIVCTIACLFFVLAKEVSYFGLQLEIDNKRAEVKSLQDENTKKLMEIESSIDLKVIQETALNEYGMVKPEKNQIIYIDVSSGDKVQKTSKENSDEINDIVIANNQQTQKDEKTAEGGLNKYISNILGMFGIK